MVDVDRSARTPAALATAFLQAVKRSTDDDEYVAALAELDPDRFENLDTDAATAFWINVYNGFVQRHLERDPSLYDTKRRFFGEARITVAGTNLSLDDIEHGILRSSKWKYGLGYIPRPFPSDFERVHRLPSVDPRIHFALNCGAESCPPILAYTATDIDAELETATRSFLSQSSTRTASGDQLSISRLFLYYRGDFGGRYGIYEFLERYDIIEANERPRIRYDSYDWTLHKGLYRNPSD
jgi:hypothetical protein